MNTSSTAEVEVNAGSIIQFEGGADRAVRASGRASQAVLLDRPSFARPHAWSRRNRDFVTVHMCAPSARPFEPRLQPVTCDRREMAGHSLRGTNSNRATCLR